jgi:hypothetical protein
METIDDNQQLDEFCTRWAQWHRSRRLFAPPIPLNILARMRPQPVREAPDAILSADLSYFNLALLGQPEGTAKMAFYLYYLHEMRPIKTVAAAMDISPQAFYKALKKCRSDSYALYTRMMSGQETETVDKTVVDEIAS